MQQSAPVYSLAEEQRSRAESAAWARFAAAGDDRELFDAWLSLTASRIGRARAALLLTRGESSSGQAEFGVTAVWPDARQDLQYLGPVAQRVLEAREGLSMAPDGGQVAAADGAAHVGYPLLVGSALRGAVLIDVGPGPQAGLQDALRQLHWASAWLVDHFRQRDLAAREAELARHALINEVMATAMQHDRLQPSLLAVANELTARLACDRVSVGFERAGQVVPQALSNTATFDVRSDLARWIGEAMDEVLDLGVPLMVPAPEAAEFGALAHAESARALGNSAMLSVPVRHAAQTIGVLCFERRAGAAFDERERELAAAIGTMLGPVWALMRERERGLAGRVVDRSRELARELAGPRHPGLKLGAGITLAVMLVIGFWQTEHRISARTVVEGSTQIAAVAPFDGFIAQSMVRAGETVRKGQPLARLDDRDLQLERSRWQAEREQLERRYQVAQAQGDRPAMGVLAAQMNQAEAQLSLAEERIARAVIAAPFDGIVVSGDLSQQIGSPVETGKLLFEVAPLQGFRVMMEVDDRDIARVAAGQAGELVLSGLPDRRIGVTVRRITPVATQKDGRNFFAVEASVGEGAPAGLRPGMEGVSRVGVGDASLLWIWTRGFVDWVRLALWSWLP